MRIHFLFLALCMVLTTACYKVSHDIDPQFCYAVQDRYIKQLPKNFSTLSEQERKEEWGKEYLIAQNFAREIDLYRAITTFKRSEFLCPQYHLKRLEEIQYQILLSYYLGQRYDEVVQKFDHSYLSQVQPSFPAYHDLLIIMYDTYLKIGQREKADYILRLTQYYYPEEFTKLKISTALIEGDLPALRQQHSEGSYPMQFVETYDAKKKSVSKAQWANALLPGAGYLYVGQKQSALTAFLLNALFIYAAFHFYSKGNIAAGVITTSFEMGWYCGGIYGSGEAAKTYNERLYEKQTYSFLHRNKLFPVLMLQYGF